MYNYLCFPMFQVPKFNMPISYSYEIISIFGESDRFYFGTDFVTRYFDIILPIPYVNYHIMLCPDADYVLICRRKCLKNFNIYNGINKFSNQKLFSMVMIQYRYRSGRLYSRKHCISTLFIALTILLTIPAKV